MKTDKRSFRDNEVRKLTSLFIESKTIGFQRQDDRDYMRIMFRLNPKEFEQLERRTHEKVMEFYREGGKSRSDKQKRNISKSNKPMGKKNTTTSNDGRSR
jgi:hypothetical protein